MAAFAKPADRGPLLAPLLHELMRGPRLHNSVIRHAVNSRNTQRFLKGQARLARAVLFHLLYMLLVIVKVLLEINPLHKVT